MQVQQDRGRTHKQLTENIIRKEGGFHHSSFGLHLAFVLGYPPGGGSRKASRQWVGVVRGGLYSFLSRVLGLSGLSLLGTMWQILNP